MRKEAQDGKFAVLAPRGHEVSNNIRNALVEEFGFEPEVAARMRSAEKRGKYGGHRVTFVINYDPTKLPGVREDYRSLRSLRSGVDFAGRVETDGSVHLVDRRSFREAA